MLNPILAIEFLEKAAWPRGIHQQKLPRDFDLLWTNIPQKVA